MEPQAEGVSHPWPYYSGPEGMQECMSLSLLLGVMVVQSLTQVMACQVCASTVRKLQTMVSEATGGLGAMPWGVDPDRVAAVQANEAALQQAIRQSRLHGIDWSRRAREGSGGET